LRAWLDRLGELAVVLAECRAERAGAGDRARGVELVGRHLSLVSSGTDAGEEGRGLARADSGEATWHVGVDADVDGLLAGLLARGGLGLEQLDLEGAAQRTDAEPAGVLQGVDLTRVAALDK